jgi:hypothetical protein
MGAVKLKPAGSGRTAQLVPRLWEKYKESKSDGPVSLVDPSPVT